MTDGSSGQPPAYYFRRAVDSITASPVITGGTLASIAVSVLFAGAVWLVSSNAYRMVALWATAGVDVAIYLSTDIGDEAVMRVKNELDADAAVAHLAYISQDEAWQFLADNLSESASLLEGLDSSLLPPSFEVTLDSSLDDDAIAERLDGWAALAGVDDVQHNPHGLSRGGNALMMVRWVVLSLGMLALVASIIIVAATFQLAAQLRRDELDVMRLMGAVGRLYWGPIVLAGVIEGLAAGTAAVGLLLMAYLGASAMAASEAPALASTIEFLTPGQVLVLIGWGALLGALGSILGMWRVTQWR